MPQQLRAEHRRQAQREEARKGDRADHRRRELAEQQAGLAGDEHDRHEHRADHHRRRDDREADLARAVEGGGERRLALLDPVIDILEHDDRVVDDDADRQHQREQGQQVDREAEQPQHREAARAGRAAR